MEYIIETRGYQTIPNMLKAFRDGMSQTEVFGKVVGIPEQDFDAVFRAWAKKRLRGWGFKTDPPPKLAEAEKTAKENPEDVDAQARHAEALYTPGNTKRPGRSPGLLL